MGKVVTEEEEGNVSMLGAPRRVFGLIPRRIQIQSVRKVHGDGEERMHLYKSRGQHLLVNPRILDTIVRRSEINPTDIVLEIGPGTGNLTLHLLEAAHRVFAIEIDERMVQALENRAAQRGLRHKLKVIRGDALRTRLPRFDLVVANIPYGISSPLVIKLVYGETSFRSATLLLQKEFARRLLANPGDSDSNRLAVNVKLLADVELVMDVSKRDFLPSPKVDSSVVIIRPKDQVPNVDRHEWRAFTRTCFRNRNKTLGAIFKQKRGVGQLLKLLKVAEKDDDDDDDEEDEGECQFSPSLEGGKSLFKEKILGVLRAEGFEDKRPSKLSIEELLHLLSSFNQAGIYFNDRPKLRNEEDTFAGDNDG